MTTLLLPPQQIALPRVEFPAWVRRIGDSLHMGQLNHFGGAASLEAMAAGVLNPSLGLKTNLLAAWELNEASGDAVDSHTNGLTLTDTNTVTSAAGVGGAGTARQFTRSNTEYFVRNSETLLQMGAINWAGCCWYYRDTTDDGFLLTKDAVAGSREFTIGWESAGNTLTFRMFVGSATSQRGIITIATAGAGVWQFVMWWQTTSDNKIHISIDDGTPSETTLSADVDVGTGKFSIGGRPDGGGNLTFNGRIQAFRVWKNFVPTAQNITALYNGGAVVPYASL